MAQIRPLAHAPIVEALIDLKVQPAEGMTVEHLDEAAFARDFGYYKKSPILRGQFGFILNTTETPAAVQAMPGSAAIVGTRLHSKDEKYVAQFLLDGFTLSRLEPYESWEVLVTEAQRLWRQYIECAHPSRIHRTATRFINNLRLPVKEGERFERYLLGLPKMPDDYPQTVSSFLQRFVIQDAGCGATAIVTQALEPFVPQAPVPVILDVDVFREMRFAIEGPEVWAYLDELRALKNRLFFGALTEEAVELYQ